MGSKSCMFGIELPTTFHLYFIACRPAIFDAAMDIYTGVDVVTKVMGEGLIDLLITVATSTSLVAWRAVIVA